MTENTSRYYAAELEERLEMLSQLPNDDVLTFPLFVQIAVATFILPHIALLIGWFTL